MVGIQGVGGVPEPSPERPANVRDRRRDENVAQSAAQDGVENSDRAQEAVNVSRFVELAREESEVREERVAEARERLDREDFRLPERVAEVARRLSRFLP